MKSTSSSLPPFYFPIIMKIPHSYFRLAAYLPALVATVCLALSLLAARADQINELEIDVRADIDGPPPTKELKGAEELAQAVAGKKIYVVAPAQYLAAVEKLVKPVDGAAILAQLCQELDRHGFHPAASGETPEIVITLHYGRGYLRNPYLGAGVGQIDELSMGGMTVSIMMPTIDTMGLRGTGVEAKLQKAQFEKLVLAVCAWDYPKQPHAKPHRLWKTVMYVDDPDHRDLGALYSKMLEAGGDYFNRRITKEELEIYKPLPVGKVKLGPLNVMEEPKSGGK